MTASTHGRRNLDDMSVRERVAIRMLNNGLSKIEYWIHQQCASLLRETYSTRAIRTDSANVASLQIDVRCILHESDPCFDPCSENIVAKLDGLPVVAASAGIHEENWPDTYERLPHALSDVRICYLFRDLYEHGVARDWDELVRIGEISVEVSRRHVSRPPRGA
ncbi:hypothetical protein [Burkholderia cepacia]|uniref:hypothetical protein n=1 Tax=Burkholderia cepacia TaxID=292 RepID=UPI0012DACF5C|nr:hypothetical protein [Burkholderia cepacia]